MMRGNRLLNIECLRCIAMLFIVLNHCILNIAIKRISLNGDPINFCFIDLLYQIVYTGVNIFVLISGYFLVNNAQNTTNWAKVIQLWLTVFFYSVIIYFGGVIIGWENLNLQNLIHYLMPIRYDSYWFMTQYIGLYVMSPFFAKWARSMTKQEYKAMLVSLFILTSVIQLQGLKGGFSLIWFIFLFMFAGYIRLYENESAVLRKWNKKSGLVFVIFSLLLFLLSFPINGDTLDIVSYFGFYNGPFLFILSVSIFLYFKKKKESKIIINISKLSPYMFGVYLIHEHPILKQHMWNFFNEYLNNVNVCNLCCVAFIVLIFSILIEYIRQFIFEILKINNAFFLRINALLVVIAKCLKNLEYVRISKEENR